MLKVTKIYRDLGKICFRLHVLILLFSFRCTCFCLGCLPYVRIDLEFIYSAVTMTGPQALPPEGQCKDKFLIKSVVASPCATTEDVVRKLVIL